MVTRIRAGVFGLLCLLAGAAFMMLVGTSKVPEVLSGRYQVSALGNGAGAFVLDTQTGHLWCAVQDRGDWDIHSLGTMLEHDAIEAAFRAVRAAKQEIGEAQQQQQPDVKK